MHSPVNAKYVIELDGDSSTPTEIALTKFMTGVLDLAKDSKCLNHGLNITKIEVSNDKRFKKICKECDNIKSVYDITLCKDCSSMLELDDEWFEEVCWKCGKEKLVHNDMNSDLGNPAFICKKCEGLNSDK